MIFHEKVLIKFRLHIISSPSMNVIYVEKGRKYTNMSHFYCKYLKQTTSLEHSLFIKSFISYAIFSAYFDQGTEPRIIINYSSVSNELKCWKVVNTSEMFILKLNNIYF